MNPLRDLYRLLFPPLCTYCHRELADGEEVLCTHCAAQLARIHDVAPGNPAERREKLRFPFIRGAAFCYYHHHTVAAEVIKAAKYRARPSCNAYLTRLFLPELEAAEWLGDVDVIVPVPIHWLRRLSRGYNQAEPIARTLGERWGIRVDTKSLRKVHYRVSRLQERKRLSYGLKAPRSNPFRVVTPERLTGCHVLIVDDVHTAGTTLNECAEALLQVPGVRLSFLTLGLAL
jgi:ComF family protein